MKQVKTGSVIFHKRSKMFMDNSDDCCFTHNLYEAYIYENHNQAQNNLDEYDEPDGYEVWDIEVVYKTVE